VQCIGKTGLKMDKGKRKFDSVRAPQQNKFLRSAFAQTYTDTYEPTYSETYSGNDELEVIPPDIFDADNLSKTTWHVHTQAENPFYGLSAEDMETVDLMLDEIEFLGGISPGQNEYSSTQDGGSLTISKAIDPDSDDTHLSYNKVVLEINGVHIEWYFKMDDGEDVKDAGIKNIQKDPGKGEILYTKNEANKGEFNNTGYSFSWSDGRKMENRDVTIFIRQKKKGGDQRFINDFPVVKGKDEKAPTYTIPGSKYTYYAYDSRQDDPLLDKDNLSSDLLKGNTNLELVHDGELFIDAKSPAGEDVLKIKQALNLIYKDDKTFTPLKETNNFDALMKIAVQKFQKGNALKGQNGVVGKETIKKLDELVSGSEKKKKEEEEKKEISQRGGYEISGLKISKDSSNNIIVSGVLNINVKIINLSAANTPDLLLQSKALQFATEAQSLLSSDGTYRITDPFDLDAQNNMFQLPADRPGVDRNVTYKISTAVHADEGYVGYLKRDFVIAIVDEIPGDTGFGATVGLAPIGRGRVCTVEIESIKTDDGWLSKSLHEFFHLLGLAHYWKDKPGDEGPNLMNYGKESERNLNSEQIYDIYFNMLGPWNIIKTGEIYYGKNDVSSDEELKSWVKEQDIKITKDLK
jgi:hypothetical protein